MAREFAKAFYNSKDWQQARDYCMMRDHYTCLMCGRAAEEVHHIIPLTPDNINNYLITINPDNLMCLCHDCHMKEHSNEVLQEINSYEFDSNGLLVKKKF